jgi:di/tripeptidase
LPKNNDVNFDFETEGIKMEIDGDWVKAKGTTLGADNGLGVATIMSIWKVQIFLTLLWKHFSPLMKKQE